MCYIKFIICLGLTYFDGHIPLRAVHAHACPYFWEIGVLLLSVMAIYYVLKILYSHLHIYVYLKYVFIIWAVISSYFIYMASKSTYSWMYNIHFGQYHVIINFEKLMCYHIISYPCHRINVHVYKTPQTQVVRRRIRQLWCSDDVVQLSDLVH